MSELIINGIDGMISDAHVYDFAESIRASKYPMAVDLNKPTAEVTKMTKTLGSCGIGEGHDNFLNGIRVAFDLTFSNKAWVEMERYHFVDFVSSQSTMHRITQFDVTAQTNEYVDTELLAIVARLIDEYNADPTPERYLQVLYSVPSGFKLTARLTTNYRQLKTIYYQRRNHRLPEWRTFCKWIEELPYFKEIVLKREANE